ncbi:MAG: serine/threonine-protein kinase [Vicinamibacterales bacterium]
MARYIPTGVSDKGGFGSVAFYRDTSLDRQVAVKFLNKGEQHRRLLDELAALQKIRSKHVVEIFDVMYIENGTRMGIVEEFVRGDTLKSQLGRVSGDAFVRLLYQLATGVSDIHAVDIVHRDIKPSNLLVDHEGILKIVDFNLARTVDEAKTHGFVGTRGYAAPEQYADDDVTFDEKIDVYALGICAWALLHGDKLPDALAARPPKLAKWISEGGGFAAAGTQLDPQLVAQLDACLRQDPAQRSTAAAIAHGSGRLLLRGRHRATFVVSGGNTFELHAGNPRVNLKHPTLGSLTLAYDGLDFRVSAVVGEVWVNNMRIASGHALPQCCVIAFGGTNLPPSSRSFTTMDVSHPEVVL